jgi:hypothetical protein
MAENLSPSELDAETVELLPARTLVTALLLRIPAAGAGPTLADVLGSGGTVRTGGQPCTDVPWWSPKPPGC